MPYRLKAKETTPEGIRRIVCEEVDSAMTSLGTRSAAERDNAIHEARKSVKKIRGVLRLVRGELGTVYGKENTRFRVIGRKLSELRDAAALRESFKQLDGKDPAEADSASRQKIALGLEREKKKIEKRVDSARTADRAIQVFGAAKQRVEQWPLAHDGFAALAPGLKETYRRGRKALRRVRKTESALDFHDFRKRVKDHWYHVRLLESIWTEVMQAHEASLKDLETWLGDDHNLVLLHEKLDRKPKEFGGAEGVRPFLKLVESNQKELREKALSLGERVYNEKPRAFVRSIESLWDAWQQQPESMSELEQEQRKAPPRKRPGTSTAEGKSQNGGRKAKSSAA